MRPTRIATLAVTAVVLAAASWLALRVAYRLLPPLPWNGVPTLVVVALVEGYTGMLLRARIHRRPGTKPVEALAVARIAVLAKASAYTAAVFGGIAAGFFIHVAGSLDKTVPRHDALTSVATFAAAAVMMAGALYLEYCCRVPKQPGDEGDRRP